MEKLTWNEAKEYLRKYNDKYGYTSKGDVDKYCTMVAVISEKSFTKEYTLEERSYRFTNENKAVLPNQGGYSIFADSLDGSDRGVRLEQYVEYGDWEVEYCYIESED